MEWTIKAVADASGTTVRALRHYQDLGLLTPSRVAENGYRYCDEASLLRLQRILLLRQVGMPLAAIANVLAGDVEPVNALRQHLAELEREEQRVHLAARTVRQTIARLERGDRIVAEELFEGFDHSQYKDEVTERWGAEAYTRSDSWWRSLTTEQRRAFQEEQREIAAAFGNAAASGLDPASGEVQALAARQVAWLSGPVEVSGAYLAGIGAMYVDDARFGENYDRFGPGTAILVRDALAVYAERHLT